MELHEQSLGSLSRRQIARYAGAVRDFNPVHVDERFATASGMPSVIAHGPLTLGLAIDAIVEQVGRDRLAGFEARLKAPTLPDEELTMVPVDGGIEVRSASGAVVATAKVALR
ncbi:MAG TPA: MaoC/PaaZ C-terminal domain-containing protein [Acidimicrobiales bacterium]|nr:MaoC/PaaZ C-terminal domain-containing protein [Acidimicrobiales bacterium]